MSANQHWWSQSEFLVLSNSTDFQPPLQGRVKIGEKGVDLFIAGPCAYGIQHESIREIFEDHPLDPHLVEILMHLKRARVVMFAACCGAYSPEFKKALQDEFPNIEWILPDVTDFEATPFFDLGHREAHLVEELCKLGVLRIE